MTELAAETPEERARGLLRLTLRLIELLEAETGFFQARNIRAAAPLQEEKSGLARLYQRECALARNDPSRLACLPEALKADLQAATERFGEALARNGEAVAVMRAISEGLVQAIADEAARQRREGAGYGPDADKAAGLGAFAVNSTA